MTRTHLLVNEGFSGVFAKKLNSIFFRAAVFLGTMIFIFFVSPAHAKKPKKQKGPTNAEIVSSFSLDQIEQVSNYLLARVEADPLPKGTKILECDPSMTKVNAWLSGPVHALIDEKRAAELDGYKKAPESFAERIKGCDRRCTCNVYQMLFEDLGDSLKENSAHARNVAAMKSAMRNVGKDQSLKCARDLTWFCSSKMHKFLELQ